MKSLENKSGLSSCSKDPSGFLETTNLMFTRHFDHECDLPVQIMFLLRLMNQTPLMRTHLLTTARPLSTFVCDAFSAPVLLSIGSTPMPVCEQCSGGKHSRGCLRILVLMIFSAASRSTRHLHKRFQTGDWTYY